MLLATRTPLPPPLLRWLPSSFIPMKNDNSLRDQAYQSIRKKMLMGRLSAGSQISEPKLAKMLGIGRTPVREAIQQLQVEGLVERVPRRGTVIRVPKRIDIVDLYELREGLEGYAVALAAKRIGSEDLELLRLLNMQMAMTAEEMKSSSLRSLTGAKLQTFKTADMGFHLQLINATGNRHIMKIISDSHVMSQIFSSTRDEHTLDVVQMAAKMHGEIYEAVARSDGEMAATLMTQHIRRSLRETLEYFDRQEVRTNSDATGLQKLPLPPELLAELERIQKPPETN